MHAVMNPVKQKSVKRFLDLSFTEMAPHTTKARVSCVSPMVARVIEELSYLFSWFHFWSTFIQCGEIISLLDKEGVTSGNVSEVYSLTNGRLAEYTFLIDLARTIAYPGTISKDGTIISKPMTSICRLGKTKRLTKVSRPVTIYIAENADDKSFP